MIAELDPGLDAVRGPLMVLDAEGRILIWNHACAQLTGYGFDEVRGRCPWECVAPPEEMQRAKRLFQEVLTEQGVSFLGGYVVDKTGRRHWIDWACHVVRRSDGGVDFVPAIGIQRTDAPVEHAGLLSETIVAKAGDAILAIDEQQQIVVYNDGAARVFGWAQAEALGKSIGLLIPDLEDTRAREASTSALCLVARRKTGEDFPIEATISEFEIDGTPWRSIVLRDATWQKRAEREQRFLAELVPALCAPNNLGDVLTNVAELSVRFLADCCTIYWLDEQNVLHTRVVHSDPSKSEIADALERVQLDPAQTHLCSPAMDARRPSPVLEMTPDHLDGLEQSEEYRGLVRKLEPVEYIGLPLVSGGKELGAIVLISCNTKRCLTPHDVMLGQQLASHAAGAIDRALVLRAALRAVDKHKEVLGIVAHDLRNPITAARLAIQRLMRDESAERREFSRKTLELALRALDRLSRLVQDLLMVSQVEAGQVSLERKPLAPDEIIREVMETFAPAAAAASLRIDTQLDAPLPPVLADRHKIEQLFSNLVGNAIKFTTAGGRIWLGAERSDGEVRFWVKDTGKGIAPEEISHVFDRFWQSRSSHRRGVGLGLDIARGIVTAHGGRIWVQSIPGDGSTFFFTLPILPEQRRRAARRQPRVTC